MDMLKNGRFWITALIIAGAILLTALKVISGESFAALVTGMLVRFGADKASAEPSGGASNGPVIRSLMALLVAGSLLLSGCCLTARCWLAAGLEGLHKADPLAVEAIKKVCEPKIKACASASCPALTQCEKALDVYRASADAAGRELDNVNKLLADLGVAK